MVSLNTILYLLALHSSTIITARNAKLAIINAYGFDSLVMDLGWYIYFIYNVCILLHALLESHEIVFICYVLMNLTAALLSKYINYTLYASLALPLAPILLFPFLT